MFGLFNKNSKIKDVAHILFTAIVDQARHSVFYEKWAVADTLDGRFDLITLHVTLVIDRLEGQRDDKDVATLIRYIQEVFFDNMDMSLREIGVGDMSVGKKVKVMAEAFYGRKAAYQVALREDGKTEALKAAVIRNIYRDQAPSDEVLSEFVSYIESQIICLSDQSEDSLRAGQVNFEQVK